MTVYDELTYVILGMAVLILVSSLLRKRLFQGITLALYGLAVFNLRFWGFGVPFLLAGAWYLVRAYRLQQALKRAEARPAAPRPRRNGARPTNGAAAAAEQALHAAHLRRSPAEATPRQAQAPAGASCRGRLPVAGAARRTQRPRARGSPAGPPAG